MSAARWSWDLDRIQAKGYTDNVVDLMVGKLNRLPVETQKALAAAGLPGKQRGDRACFPSFIGPRRRRSTADLWEAVRLEFVVRLEGL